ncbi:MAG: LytTR family DNA-binding domain-containing protein [Eubacteriales bacterium]|nr:LytTR family DNA-binding domain-containing protein [Eubacteriales bacterium]
MLRIAIVEDEEECAKTLQEYIARYEKEVGQKIHTTVYSDGDEILEEYHAQFDLILMDVQMQFTDGMTAARRIRQQDSRVVIIFITNMPQFAILGYEVEALDYVLKPIHYFAFSQRLNRAVERILKGSRQYVTIPVKGGTKRLDVSEISYIESQKHDLIYHTAEGEYLSSGTMKEAEERFSKLHFFRGNKGYLINLEHVEGIRDGCAVVNGELLLLSRGRKSAFLDALANYMGEMVK